MLGARPVSSTYTANDDCFCLLLPADAVQAAGRGEPAVRRLPASAAPCTSSSWRARRCARATRREALQQQSLEAKLSTLPRGSRWPARPTRRWRDALAQMHERHVGSVVVVDAQRAPLGILTRHDILGRVTLPALPLATPIGR